MEKRRSVILFFASAMARSHGEFSTNFLSLITILLLTSELDLSIILGMDLSQPQPFRKQIAEAQSSLCKLWTIRRVVDQKIDDLRDLIRANANFLPEPERAAELLSLEMLKIPTTIAEAIKIALFVAYTRKERLTANQLKEHAEERGFDFSGYTNPMASVHTILKRMREATPPEVEYDDATNTYLSTRFLPAEVTDPSFYARMNQKAWLKLLSDDSAKSKAMEVACDQLTEFLDSVMTRQPKLKE